MQNTKNIRENSLLPDILDQSQESLEQRSFEQIKNELFPQAIKEAYNLSEFADPTFSDHIGKTLLPLVLKLQEYYLLNQPQNYQKIIGKLHKNVRELCRTIGQSAASDFEDTLQKMDSLISKKAALEDAKYLNNVLKSLFRALDDMSLPFIFGAQLSLFMKEIWELNEKTLLQLNDANKKISALIIGEQVAADEKLLEVSDEFVKSLPDDARIKNGVEISSFKPQSSELKRDVSISAPEPISKPEKKVVSESTNDTAVEVNPGSSEKSSKLPSETNRETQKSDAKTAITFFKYNPRPSYPLSSDEALISNQQVAKKEVKKRKPIKTETSCNQEKILKK